MTTSPSYFPPPSDTEKICSNCEVKKLLHLSRNISRIPRILERVESSSMQPRRSRFTELIDIPSTNSTCSSASSELSLDDVLRETEQQKFSQNRVLSFWNGGWDHVGSGLQRQHSMPRSWLRRRNTGEIPKNAFGPSKAPRFWAALGYFPKGFWSRGGDSRVDCFILRDGKVLSQPFQFRYLLIPQTHVCVCAAAQARRRSVHSRLGSSRSGSLTLVACSSSHLL